jgi:hypothetical protein
MEMNEREVGTNPLLPDGIEGLKLRCVICTKEVPARWDKDVKDWKFEEFTA